MLRRASAAAMADLVAAIVALFFLLDPQSAAVPMAPAQAPLLGGRASDFYLLPLAAVGAHIIAVALTYRHLASHTRAAVPAAGAAASGRLSAGLRVLTLCVSAGVLVQPAGGVGVGPGARALGLAALRALPAAATATFFLGMTLLLVAHVRAGGEGGGGSAAVARGGGPVPEPEALRVVTNIALGAAGTVVLLMAAAIYAVMTAAPQ